MMPRSLLLTAIIIIDMIMLMCPKHLLTGIIMAYTILMLMSLIQITIIMEHIPKPNRSWIVMEMADTMLLYLNHFMIAIIIIFMMIA